MNETTSLTLVHKERLSDSLLRLDLAMPNQSIWHFHEGQYATLSFAPALKPRHYSIADHAGKKTARFFIRIGNRESHTERYLEQNLNTGDPVELLDISGNTHIASLDESAAPLTMIAGGTGISQTLAFLYALKKRQDRRPIQLVFGDRLLNDNSLLREVLEHCASLNMAGLVLCSDQAPTLSQMADINIHQGSVLDGLGRIEAQHPDTVYVISGPFPMAEAIIEALKLKGVTSSRILSDYKEIAPQQNKDRSHGT